MNLLPASLRRRVRGSAAVEMALILPALIAFMAAPLFLARVFWFYSVAEKAAHDAARFLSAASPLEMQDTSASPFSPVTLLATAIADAELAEIAPSLHLKVVSITCDGMYCAGQGVPQYVRASVQIRVHDDILGPITDPFFGAGGLQLTADVTMRYAGN